MTARAFFDPLRSVVFGDISAVYASVGVVFGHEVREFRLINNTEGDMIFTDDITIAAGKWFIPKGTFLLVDVQSNGRSRDDKFVVAKGTQISVKQVTAPSSGGVYVEALY